ncbi:helix-turn-helix transcriptional regulator [Acinetobacter venetianus]|jgi:DNA-binding HxlR family transcriptional regulator|uniref:Putative HTH-type transcriptional regulator YybR n=1 Tax=Acinetobacter venetianus TaxID=52133 RepID=A0A150HUW3_9GAMM|nr:MULTISPECIES: helix-turn-helix domain-containing protein [Acinetobacter]MDA0694887.1 helix-turn-helix domain-containing protein [Pseudomonadota bacterium]KXO78091.1 HxlR family transcriptional regulator [Acinetobacter venetianus]KXO87299.1 HxlR family transcriptional regulator [Acinetobacter venetianus]KXZ62812.1 putative HTH-type transcriptional regulator YybR [Acinetobacter venetianus]KXZ70327.1 putative HTH-type transcriptional regulator YybR [Acinetobacter venetianus]
MKWEEIGDQPCSVARTLSVLGDRWTMLILRNAFMGVRRFDDFQRSLGLTRHVLSERLKRLVEHEILVKVPYVQRQERFEYQLTEKGLDLYPIILAMVQWADKWMDLGMGKPLEFTHKSCGKKINPKVVCSECNDQIHVQDVRVAAGPGYFAFVEQKQKTA